MDVRAKTFVAETGRRFGFLARDYGFNGPEVTGAEDEYPLMRTVCYRRGGLEVEISLVLAYAGEEYVSTLVTRDDDAGPARHESGRAAAHTGYQMRRALDHQAEVTLALITRMVPGHRRAELPFA